MIPIEYISETGLVRKINEDSLKIESIGDYTVFFVADGIGGLEIGGESSRIAVETGSSYLRDSLENKTVSDEDLDSILISMFKEINKEIYKNGVNKNVSTGTGTTLTVVLLNKLSLVVAHIGDSRAYMIHGSSIIKLTSDHVVEDSSHVLSKSLGENVFINPDIYRYSIMYGDLVLVCSDGVHSVLNDDEILVCLKKHKDLKGCLNNLLEAVNKKGAPDNITAILAHNKPER